MPFNVGSALFALVVFFLNSAVLAQQYVGDVIPNSLPGVPGSEITYFRINDPSGKNNNLTLTNYYTHQLNGQRIVESQIMRAVVIIHGLNRDPGTYASNMMSALSQVTSDPNVNRSTVAIMAPYFPNGDDKNYGYPWTNGLAAGKGSTSNALVWPGSQWSAGGNNQYPYTSKNTSSYIVLDQIIQYFDNTALFPNMKQIVIAGHSLGGQTVQRYAAIGQPGSTHSPVTYWVANPDSYVWFSTSRPLPTASCPIYDVYREGYTNFTQYPMTYGLSLVNSGRSNILANFNSKSINYARGTQDLGDDASTCAPETTGANRNERFFNFIAAFPPSCSSPAARNCDTVDFVNVGHDGGAMMASSAGQARLFLDNFYGNGNRSYDFGYPRQQAGDDPYPNPALNATAASTNNNTYAGNMTYWGCWSDQNPPTLTNLSYTSNANTIETCVSTCNQGGNTIAGLEFGTQCFCGFSLGYEATEVIDSSCGTQCPGNSSEICGGGNRLSLFSNGRPFIQSAPGTPETVDGSYYIGCYTEATTGRALTGNSASGPFMTLEYCGNFCSGYQYFGTEYGDECYCGNSFAVGANITSDNDCSMLCANNTAEFCGAGNRLTVYQNTTWVAPSSSSTTSTLASSTTTGVGSSSTGAVCPSSNNTVVTSNGKNFTIECGFDHQGGDLTSTSVNSFQSCIDACAQNSQCVDVSLSGSACYLKSTLGAAVANAGISGAKLITDTSSTSAATSSGQSATSGSQTGTSSSIGSNTASSTPTISTSPAATPVACPGSNSTIFTANNTETFLIECGIDHSAGDMSSLSVNSFADCINACASTSGCVDVSLSGSACYLKSSVGAAVQNGVWGARLVNASSTSSSSTGTQSTASVSTSVSGSNQISTSSSTSVSTQSSIASQSVPVTSTSTITLLSSTSSSQSLSASITGSQSFDSSSTLSATGSSVATTLQSGSSSGTATSLQTASSQGTALPSSLSTIASNTDTNKISILQSSSSSNTGSISNANSVPASSSASTSITGTSSQSGSTVASPTSSPVSSTLLTSTVPASASGSSQASVSSSVSSTTGGSTSASTQSSDSTSTNLQSASALPQSSDTLSSSLSTTSTGTVSTFTSSSDSIFTGSSSAVSLPTTLTASTPASASSSTSGLSGSILDSTASSTSSTSGSLIPDSIVSSLSSPIGSTSTPSPSTASPGTLSTGTSSLSSAVSNQPTATGASSSSSGFASSSSSDPPSSLTQTSTSTQTTSILASTPSSTSALSSQSTTSASSSSTSSGMTQSAASIVSTLSSQSSSSSSSSSSALSSTLSATSTSFSSPSTFSTSTLKSSSTILSSSSTTAASTSLPSGFSTLGCYVDSTSSRVLPHSNGTSTTQTPQQCALNCRALSYKYSGTEYASECWCGNAQPTTTATATSCNLKCSGDKTQICGAGNRLSVTVDNTWKQTFFAAPTYKTWNLMACYVDSTSSRLLSHSVSLSAYGGGANATIGNCMDACAAKGYLYCGEEYYTECYGSNSVPPASAVAAGADPLSAGCNYACKGNITEACGGSNRILVYINNGTVV